MSVNKIIASVVLIMALQLTTGCSIDDNVAESSPPIAVRVASPQLLDMSEHLTYIGSVHATIEIPVMSQVQGTVVSIPIEEGLSISKGDMLVKLAVPDLAANVKKVEAEHAYWEQHLNEDKNLLAKNAISQEQMDISTKAFETSLASLAEVKSRLRKAKEVAQFDGTVLKHFVEQGQHVMPGQSLLLIGNNELELHVEVVQEDINKGISVGTAVDIITNQGGKIASKISSVASAPTGIGRTFTVKIKVPLQAANQIRLGEALTVGLILNQQAQVLAVPETALFSKDNQQYVYLIKKSRAIRTAVTLGIKQAGWAATDFEWNGTDPVAVSNVTNLTDSTVVYAVEDES